MFGRKKKNIVQLIDFLKIEIESIVGILDVFQEKIKVGNVDDVAKLYKSYNNKIRETIKLFYEADKRMNELAILYNQGEYVKKFDKYLDSFLLLRGTINFGERKGNKPTSVEKRWFVTLRRLNELETNLKLKKK